MSRKLRTALALMTLLAAGLLGSAPSVAEGSFPTKPVRIINPLPPGSAPDVVARLVAEQLSRIWEQQVVVENRAGGMGVIAAQAVAAAPADGYTILMAAGSMYTILPAQKNKPSLDMDRSFVPTGLMGGGAMYLAVSPKLGVATLPEFIKLAHTRPHQIIVGTVAAGTAPNFAALALAKLGDIPVNIVPYATGGTLEAIKDIMGGHAHATIDALAGLRGAVQSGDLKLLAVMSPDRAPLRPDVPAVSETIPGFSAVGFLALAAPAGTPKPVVQRLSDGLRQALSTEIVRQRLDEFDMQRPALSPAETQVFIEGEERLWWPLVNKLEAK